MGSTAPPWLVQAERKRALQRAAIDSFLAEYPPLPAAERHATESIPDIDRVEELLSSISTRAVSAVDVVVAYTHRPIGTLTEVLFDDALAHAKELDRHLAATGKPIGPLHGLPVTLKDQFDVKGYDSTIGYVAKAFRPASEDAVVVALLRELGAIIIAKTNLPQSIMWCETENPLWGLTTNPRNPAFTPGGSTGGESALLAEHGSIIGWGTDIGGSIRIPSHMLGLYGLKPSSGRLPYQNVTVSTDGQEHVPSVIGPLARSLCSLRFVTKAVVDAAPWQYDPKVVPLPWRADIEAEIQSRPLVIGLLVDDGVVRVHPPIERVVRETARKLEEAGHEVIPWDYSGHQECIEIMDQFYTADGGEDIRREVLAGGEPFIPHVEALVNRGKPISVYEYWQLNKLKHEQQKRYLDKWNAVRSPSGRKVDVLLTPVMPHSAVPHRGCRWVGYTKVWNFLDYSAVVLPGGAVDKNMDAKADTSYQPRNELDKWNWSLYDPESMDGMPVGLQIVGRKLEEEKVLGAAKVVESILQRK
ncbi:Acetamidase [Lasiodiplodia theobromae]|uniref:Acetamidase n=1 Tax=Lasiodiplodia theobromae TaxID=45133 RepID=UPI0015C3E4AC|nr:Acetamidase [Lasiodiplodia theobromae]KAF4538402.1 Acetamidase [Lasiodiplodia theobromae]